MNPSSEHAATETPIGRVEADGGRTALLVVAGLLCVAVFFTTFSYVAERWGVEEYSHGPLIVAIAAWLFWVRRGVVKRSFGRATYWGLVVVLLAMIVHIVGQVTAIHFFSEVGFVAALVGVALSAGGVQMLKVVLLPITYLLFAIPPPPFAVAQMTLKLQLISSQLGAAIIRLFEIPVYVDGDIIDLGYHRLEIAEACSGLRYLFPLLSLGFFCAYVFRAPTWQRIVVFLSTIPITIVMNSVRIAVVGVTVTYWGSRMLDDSLHELEGWIVFASCLALLLLEIQLLARFSGRSFVEVFGLPTLKVDPSIESRPLLVRRAPLAAVVLVMATFGLANHVIANRAEIIPERPRFADFPDQIGDWQGRTSLLDQETEQTLHLDDYILSSYAGPNGKGVGLYVAYYATQRTGVVMHPPLLCLPGSGWTIVGMGTVDYSDDGINIVMNRLVIEHDSIRQVVYYWYDERGRRVANEYLSRLLLLADAITKNRTDGSMVRLSTPILFGESETDADSRLRSFMHDVLPKLTAYLPGDAVPKVRSALNANHGLRL
jgi:exosortase D (VPLPA-CTERM-specific)